jgi:hypothetical protein
MSDQPSAGAPIDAGGGPAMDASPSPADRVRLWTLAGCIALLCAAGVAFTLLYLYFPKGRWPPHGFAPDIGAAYGLPAPNVVISPRTFTRLALGLQAAMWAAFFTCLLLISKLRGPAERRAFRLIVVGGALASLALILTPPTLSTDLYRYAMFGRMIITRGLNPYVTTGNAIAGDPIVALADGRGIPTHYGPLFTDLSLLATWIGGGRAIRTALAFKVMATAFGAVAAWAIVVIARQQRRSDVLPLALVALNPLVLLETAGSAHNEPIMMGLALGGLAVAGKGKRNLGFALLVASVHIKWITAVLLGLVAIARLREFRGLRARARELATMLAIVVAVTFVLYLPFMVGRTATGGVRRVLAEGGLPVLPYICFIAIVLTAVAVVARSGHRRVCDMAGLTCLAFIVLVFGWVLPWYIIPAITLIAVGPFTRLNATLFVLTTAVSLFLMTAYAVVL